MFHLIAGLSINRRQAGRKRVGTSVYVSIAYDGSGLIWTSFDGLEHDRLVEVIRPAAAPTTTNGEGWPRREKRKKRKKATKARGSHEREKSDIFCHIRGTHHVVPGPGFRKRYTSPVTVVTETVVIEIPDNKKTHTSIRKINKGQNKRVPAHQTRVSYLIKRCLQSTHSQVTAEGNLFSKVPSITPR